MYINVNPNKIKRTKIKLRLVLFRMLWEIVAMFETLYRRNN